MDILEPKSKRQLDKHLIKIINQLKFFNGPIELKGSAGLQSQKYFSDFDFFTVVNPSYNVVESYGEFERIIKDITKNENNYFVEFKIQTYNKRKVKWFKFPDDFDFEQFFKLYDNIDFCKLDLIIYFDYRFYELSCIYKFSSKQLSEKESISLLKKDINEYKKENNYYKILKRLFSINATKKNKEQLVELTKFFNSPTGEQYSKLSNLEAIKKILETQHDDKTIKKVIINLKALDIDPNIKKIDDNIDNLFKTVNQAAKIYYDELNV